MAKFAEWVQHEPWTFVYDGRDPTDMVERFNFLLELNLEQCCPTKTIKSTNLDGKIRSVAVDQVCRRKKREHTKHGNSAKFKKLKKEAEATLKKPLLDEFLPELTAPVAAIYREAIATHSWPATYKKEHHIPLPSIRR